MLQKKLAESLTTRIFLLTFLILLGAGAVTFGLIAWISPMTYTAVVNDDLTRQVDALVEKLAASSPDKCGPLLDEFLRDSGANAVLTGPDGQIVETGSQIAIQAADENTGFPQGERESAVTYATAEAGGEAAVTVTTVEQAAVTADVEFPNDPGHYLLYVTPSIQAENLAVQSLAKLAPWLLLVMLAFSLLCAFVYSRYITRPILRLSSIAGKMAQLDFDWQCGEARRDEIGKLGRSLDEMSQRLSSALSDLEAANSALQGEVERQKELDRQRLAFFSAASHELKTPVTILKGQISGMLEGVGVYQDRDKYLLRSLSMTGRMEKLIQEMLSISRMETGALTVRQEPLDLSAVVKQQVGLDTDLLEQRHQRLVIDLTPSILVAGDISLLGKAVENLLSNASLYSPEGAEIRVWCGLLDGCPALTVENTGAHIGEESLPHLFEPFYREEISRNRSTGGSGLGLYLVKMILDRHQASCIVENTKQGVRAVVSFPPSAEPADSI